jgi:PAS domain S-box-containing protein
MLQAAEFRRRFFYLILLTWTIPPVFGLIFIVFIRILSPEQLVGILLTPLEPVYVLGWLAFALWYFPRYMRPISVWLADPDSVEVSKVLELMRRFPLHYWGIFLVYLLLAPASVIISAEVYTDYVAQPVDWFRIHLVALIVSIIVGLPIFFLILDLFGRALCDIEFMRAHVTVKTKVFLIGALVPLLIDTMIVQYYWTRTGFFTFETFTVWLFLELLAIGGSLIFVRSFGQSLAPLQGMMNSQDVISQAGPLDLVPMSTDELGVLTTGYQKLLEELRVRNEILALNNRLLRSVEESNDLADLIDTIIKLSGDAASGDMVFLLLKDQNEEQLIGVAKSDAGYDPAGHFCLSLDEASVAGWVHRNEETLVINDAVNDPRVSIRLREKYDVHTALAAPLIADGKAIGVLMTISHDKNHHYTKREVALFEGLAREAALVINTARLKEQRRQAEEAEAEREKQVRLLLDSTAEAIYGVDLEGGCTFVNPACVQMLGYKSEEDLLGKDMHDLIHHTYPDGTPYPTEDCHVRQATMAGKSSHIDNEVHWRADGSSFPVEYWSHPIRRNDEIIGSVVTFFDITERVKAEEELQHYRDELEQRVVERTAELTAVNKELESFSYSVSHDLRSPLRAIDGFSQALLDEYHDVLGADGQHHLERVRHAAQRMGSLIDDMLNLSRVTRSEIKREVVDLSALGWQVMDELQKREPQRKVEINIMPEISVKGDYALLHIVLENLLGNAWKYTGEMPLARIEFGTEILDNETVYFVQDNGIGFDMKYANKLFMPFQRLHTSDKFPGTGIGLATVARIIERHSGRIWVEASPNQGARFRFTLS